MVVEVLAVIQSSDPSLASAAMAIVIGVVGMTLLLAKRHHLHGTTLMAPCHWALVSLGAMVTCEAYLGWKELPASSVWTGSLRYAAAATTFCPVMAVLGAKRPQDRAWQLIVFSMWVILVLPAAESLVYQRAGNLEVRDARVVFLWILVAVGFVNHLPTRFWPSALLFCVGQGCLFSGQSPFRVPPPETLGALLGLGCLVAALGLVAAGIPRRGTVDRPEDRVWLDFRDMFGAVWGLRISERVNASSSMYGWQVILRWHGFRPARGKTWEQAMTGEVKSALHQGLHSLLRRFVTPEWIRSRLVPRSGEAGSDSGNRIH